MAEFRGSLVTTNLATIVRQFSGYLMFGRVQVSWRGGQGQLDFVRGQVVAARLGHKQGLAALEALALLCEGQFRFVADVVPHQVQEPFSISSSIHGLQGYLDDLATYRMALGDELPALDAVPRIADTPHEGRTADGQVLAGPVLRILLAVNGRRTAEQIAGDGSLLETMKALVTLRRSGLIVLDHPEPAASDETASHSVVTSDAARRVPVAFES